MDTLMQEQDIFWMRKALEQAEMAKSLWEVPVGAVIICEGELLASGYNQRESKQCSLAHAELLAIDAACKKLGSWRLENCTLYVTLEPCPMCSGAIINSRIARVVFGTRDPKAGCFGSLADFTMFGFNHKPDLTEGILQQECGQILSEFFKTLRGIKN